VATHFKGRSNATPYFSFCDSKEEEISFNVTNNNSSIRFLNYSSNDFDGPVEI
jgi:hypothetical protein